VKPPKLIILRGNSGSGKSTVAESLRERMGYGTALVEQDYIRRKLLREQDKPAQPNIELIAMNVRFALSRHYNVILEGILFTEHYGEMLRELVANPTDSHVYYFDISFDETLRRHKTKPNAHEFGENEMRDWFVSQDLLGVENEQIISEESGFDETVERIFRNVST
jgi:adenylate kinase family enzyme